MNRPDFERMVADAVEVEAEKVTAAAVRRREEEAEIAAADFEWNDPAQGDASGDDAQHRQRWRAFQIARLGAIASGDVRPSAEVAAEQERMRSRKPLAMPDGSELGSAGYFVPPDLDGLVARLRRALTVRAKLARVWSGTAPGMESRSLRSRDVSAALQLAHAGFERNEIAYLLVRQFDHGFAGRAADVTVGLKSAMWSADFAVLKTGEAQSRLPRGGTPALTPEAEQRLLAKMTGRA